MAHARLGLSAFALLASAAHAHAQESARDFTTYRPSFDAVRIDSTERPRIDGDLSDTGWARAAVLEEFFQVDPVVGQPTERTIAYVMYDEENLYVGVRMFESTPDSPARLMERDAMIGNDPAIRVILDPFDTRRDGYYFALNPNGARAESLFENNMDSRLEWDTIWEGDARRTEDGWSAEFAIPFRSISYDASRGSWGFQIARNVLAKNEWIRWANIDRNLSVVDLTNIGDMRIEAPPPRGVGLDTQLFASGRWSRDWTATESRDDFDTEISGNAFYRITPSLTGTLTFNTDFSDTPLDERQINTGRFALFVPETRDFFLQDAAIFEFGGRSFVSEANGTPFFSRRIGLADGAQADIIAGAKLSGRHGPFGIGALVTRTSEAGSVPEQTLTAARVTRRVLENSRVGFVFTNGDPLGVVENTVAGADFQFRAPNWNGGVLTSDASYVSSWQDGEAYGSAASETAFRSEAWNFTARLRAIEQGFDPRLGFTNRTDMRRINLNGWRAYRPSDSFIRYAETGIWQNYISDMDGAMRDRDYGFWFGGNTNAYDNFYFNYENLGATVTEPFNIDGATVQPGFYQEEVYDIEAYMAEQRPFALRAHVRWGGFFGGSMRLFEPGVIIRPNKHFELDFEYGHHDITLPDGNVEIHVGALDVKFNFTPNMQLFTQVQYDTMSENFSLASRLRWEPRPDTEVLFVVGHSAVVEENNFPRDYASTSTSATLRIGRTFRM